MVRGTHLTQILFVVNFEVYWLYRFMVMLKLFGYKIMLKTFANTFYHENQADWHGVWHKNWACHADR